MTLAAGSQLGLYEIIREIGRGGMGVVYLARDTKLDRDVAVKVLSTDTLTDESARKRFRREALALSRLNHPNIETVHDFDTQEGVDFLVMEYIPDDTLNEKIVAGAGTLLDTYNKPVPVAGDQFGFALAAGQRRRPDAHRRRR